MDEQRWPCANRPDHPVAGEVEGPSPSPTPYPHLPAAARRQTGVRAADEPENLLKLLS
jgi:hypothetical protein